MEATRKLAANQWDISGEWRADLPYMTADCDALFRNTAPLSPLLYSFISLHHCRRGFQSMRSGDVANAICEVKRQSDETVSIY
jgi:hypothetical protein